MLNNICRLLFMGSHERHDNVLYYAAITELYDGFIDKQDNMRHI